MIDEPKDEPRKRSLTLAGMLPKLGVSVLGSAAGILLIGYNIKTGRGEPVQDGYWDTSPNLISTYPMACLVFWGVISLLMFVAFLVEGDDW